MSKIPPLVEKSPLAPIENAVFEGGGVKGLAYAGALKVLKERGILNGIKRVGGSSAGGITAMLLGLGFTVEEITKEMGDMDFTKFQDAADKEFWKNVPKKLGQDSIKKLEEFLRAARSKKHGIYKGDVFLEWAKAKIAEKLGNPNATFRDLRNAMRVDSNLRDMMFTASNISGDSFSLQYFDFENTPDVRIADAVRATMSYPGAFEAYPISINGKESVFVDGGLVNNFPLKYYDQERFLMESERNTNLRTIGFRVDSADEMMHKWRKRDLSEEELQKSIKAREANLVNSQIVNSTNDVQKNLEILRKKKVEKKPLLQKKSVNGVKSSKKDWAFTTPKKKDTENFFGYAGGMIGALTSDRDLVHERGFHIVQIWDADIPTLKFKLTPDDKKNLFGSGVEATNEWCENRKNAYAERDKRMIYEKLSEVQLLEKKDELIELQEDLKELLENMKQRDPKEPHEKIEKLQEQIVKVVRELDLIDDFLHRLNRGKTKNHAEALVENVELLLSSQTDYALKTQNELEKVIGNFDGIHRTIVELKLKRDQEIQRIAAASSDIQAMLDRSLEKIENLYKSLKTMHEKINEEKRKGSDEEILTPLKIQLLQVWQAGNAEIKKMLDKAIEDTKITKEDATVVLNLVSNELGKMGNMMAIVPPAPPKNFLELRESLEKTKKKIDLNVENLDLLLSRAKQEMEKNKKELETLEQTRLATGKNPSKMLNLATNLTKFINKQNSLGNWLYQKLLMQVVSPLISFGIAAIGWAMPKKMLMEVKAYKKNLYDDYEVYSKKAEQLRSKIMTIIKENPDNIDKRDVRVIRKRADDYIAALDDIGKMGQRNPFSEIQREVVSLVAPELARAKKEQFAYQAYAAEKLKAINNKDKGKVEQKYVQDDLNQDPNTKPKQKR